MASTQSNPTPSPQSPLPEYKLVDENASDGNLPLPPIRCTQVEITHWSVEFTPNGLNIAPAPVPSRPVTCILACYDIRREPNRYTPLIQSTGMSRRRYENTTRRIEAIRQETKKEVDVTGLALTVGLTVASAGILGLSLIPRAIHRKGKKVTEHSLPRIEEYLEQENALLKGRGINASWRIDRVSKDNISVVLMGTFQSPC